MQYDAFISYSHSADGQLAPALQTGLQRLARPWYRRRALRVFRDETGLAVNPHLWDSIATAMDDSRYFVLLASPDAASSHWVNQEIERWLSTHSVETLLPVLSEGTLVWNRELGDFDPESTALPPALVGAFAAEPGTSTCAGDATRPNSICATHASRAGRDTRGSNAWCCP